MYLKDDQEILFFKFKHISLLQVDSQDIKMGFLNIGEWKRLVTDLLSKMVLRLKMMSELSY